MAPKVGNPSREREIVGLVGRQQGLVTHGQLTSFGVGERTIKRWTESGRLRPVHREVYAFGPRPLTKHGKWLAAVLAMGPGAFLSHRSAAAFWGLTRDPPKVDVTAPRGKQVRPGRKGIQVHRCRFEPDEVTTRGGIPASTVARTLFDLAERSQPYELKNAWDEASRLRVLRVPEVAAVYERGRGRIARTRIKPFLLAEQRPERYQCDPQWPTSALPSALAGPVAAARLDGRLRVGSGGHVGHLVLSPVWLPSPGRAYPGPMALLLVRRRPRVECRVLESGRGPRCR